MTIISHEKGEVTPARRRSNGGFTLIELVVVMVLVSIMLAFTFPRFEHIFNNDTRKTSQWILLQAPEYRARASSDSQTYILHADMENKRLWFSSTAMTEEESLSAMSQGYMLSDAFYIMDVLYANGDLLNAGDAPIHFYPRGYSDKVILHMEDKDGDRRSFIFEPFLSQVEIADGYVDFEE